MKRDYQNEQLAKAIKDAAIIEFGEKGYKSATIRSIAERAGVSNGMVGKCFNKKENIVGAIIDDSSFFDWEDENCVEDSYCFFCRYIDGISELQKMDRDRFRFNLAMLRDARIPSSLIDERRRKFSGSMIEKAIIKAQEKGEMISGDAFKVSFLFHRSLYELLNEYEEAGVSAPDYKYILNAIGFRQRKKDADKKVKLINEIINYTNLAIENIDNTEKLQGFLEKMQEAENILMSEGGKGMNYDKVNDKKILLIDDNEINR